MQQPIIENISRLLGLGRLPLLLAAVVILFGSAEPVEALDRDAPKDISLGSGIWGGAPSDGTTLWFVDNSANTARAYTVATRARDAAKDISLGTGEWAGGVHAAGTLWFVAFNLNRARAYTVATRARDAAKDISLGTTGWRGAMLGGTTIWFVGTSTDARAYTVATRARDAAKDISLGSGIWTGGAAHGNMLWIVDDSTDAARGYDVTTRARESDQDISLGTGSWRGAVVAANTLWFVNNGTNVAEAYIVAIPSAPRNVRLAPSSGEIAVSWDAPEDDAGSPITGYHVRYRASGDATYQRILPQPIAGRTATATGLTNGTTYEFQVSARNANGMGEWSATVTATAQGVPDAPNAPNVASRNRSIEAGWSAPAEDGGQPITDYDLRYRAVGSDLWVDWTVSGVVTTTTISGLQNGEAYELQVRAKSTVGGGAWSASATATPAEHDGPEPERPARPAITPDDTELVVTWMEPADGGTAITDYDVQYRAVSSAMWQTWAHVGTALTTTITSLTNGTMYYARVRASNGEASEWSLPARGTPFIPAVPDAPVVELTSSDKELIVTWQEPADNGRPIIDYDVRYVEQSTGDDPEWLEFDHAHTGTATVITGLENGTTYDVQVRASNNLGASDWSTTASGTPQPLAADTLERLFTHESINAFTVALAANGRDIMATWDPSDLATGYIVETRDNGVFRRQARVTDSSFRGMMNEVKVMRTPGAPVGNTDKGLTHVFLRVRAYQTGTVERYGPWTDERFISFPDYDYAAPDELVTPGDGAGFVTVIATAIQPLGFDDTSGADVAVPLWFSAVLVICGGVAWATSKDGWNPGGLTLAAFLFIVLWGVAGPIYFSVPVPLAAAPVAVVVLLGLFAAKRAAE